MKTRLSEVVLVPGSGAALPWPAFYLKLLAFVVAAAAAAVIAVVDGGGVFVYVIDAVLCFL